MRIKVRLALVCGEPPIGSSGPTGTITFYDGSATLGTATISGTTATLTTVSLTAGSHSIKASWPGNSSYSAVTSSTITQTVSGATATLTLSSSLNPSTTGVSVTFAATISNALTGTITFYDGSTSIGTGAISGSTASLATSTLWGVWMGDVDEVLERCSAYYGVPVSFEESQQPLWKLLLLLNQKRAAAQSQI